MALSKERLLKVYRDMVMIRRFEEVIEEYAANGTIPGFVHLSIGQEACQAGVVDALKRQIISSRITGDTEPLLCAEQTPN